jgi:hypothetical protein
MNPPKTESKILKKAVKQDAKISAQMALRKLGGQGKPVSAHAYALAHSEYLQTLSSPATVVGVRIPDDITVPSATTQTISRSVQTTNTASLGGATGTGVVAVLGSSANATGGTGIILFPILPNPAGADYVTGAGSTANFPWAASFAAAYSMGRPVSGLLTVSYNGSMNNATGRLILGFLAPNVLEALISTAGVGVTATSLLATQGFIEVPLPKSMYGETRFVPLDDIARAYIQSNRQAAAGQTGNQRNNAMQYGALVALVDGAPALQSIEFTFYENWEVIPQNNNLSIVQVAPSLSDPIEMAAASNAVSSLPTFPVVQSPKDAAIQSPFASTGFSSSSSFKMTQKEPSMSFMEKIMNGVKVGAGAFAKAAPIIGEIAALLL